MGPRQAIEVSRVPGPEPIPVVVENISPEMPVVPADISLAERFDNTWGRIIIICVVILSIYAIFCTLRDIYRLIFSRCYYDFADVDMSGRTRARVRVRISGDVPALQAMRYKPTLQRLEHTACPGEHGLVRLASLSLDVPPPRRSIKIAEVVPKR